MDFAYRAFEKAFRPSTTANNPLHKLKGVDASSLSPCEAELQQHIHRFVFVAKIWADADQQTIDPTSSTWKRMGLINNQYEIIWFEGLQLQDTLVPDREDDQCEDDDSAVVLSSDDKHVNGELSSENDDDDAGYDYWTNLPSHYRSCHM